MESEVGNRSGAGAPKLFPFSAPSCKECPNQADDSKGFISRIRRMRRLDLPPAGFFFQLHCLCTTSLYIIFMLCIVSNLYVLFCREDTVLYLRVYHLIVGGLMLSCMVIMLEFLARARGLPKLNEPHEMPAPALIGMIALTIGVLVGFFYLIIFNYAFAGCDKLVDALYGSELYLDAIYSCLMICFCVLSLLYILQRRYYGSIDSSIDRIGRLWINITFCVVWIKVVVYKGYLSHQELCQRKELEGYWCPVMQRDYDCSPSKELKGTQQIWYYLHKGLLNTAVMSCASEVFPVLLIAHWLACGNAEETAEQFLRKQQRGVRSLLRQFVKDISRVYSDQSAHNVPPLKPAFAMKTIFNLISFIAAVFMTIRWLVFFYYSMDYNKLFVAHWMVNDVVQLIASTIQLFMFAAVYIWARTIGDDRLDAHHRASARGDVIILFGCCTFLAVKCALQLLEFEYQSLDGFIFVREAVTRMISLFFIHSTEWLQYLSVRRLLALSDRDAKATRHFLPFIALTGVIVAWVHFGVTFLDTSIIHFQLTEEGFQYSETTLLCMIFTQTLFPADYLYAFTISGCWLEILIRYLDFGFFQLGNPALSRRGTISRHNSKQRILPSDERLEFLKEASQSKDAKKKLSIKNDSSATEEATSTSATSEQSSK